MAFRYKLLRGVHSQEDGTFVAGVKGRDVFVNERDLTPVMNPPGSSPRVQVLGTVGSSSPHLPSDHPAAQAAKEGADTLFTDSGREPPPDDGLDEMIVPDLKKLANDMEVDLSGATKKDQIIAKIREVAA